MKYTLTIASLFLSLFAMGQFDFEGAKQRADHLRSGVLIVRLYDDGDRIDYLRSRGMNDKADDYAQINAAENREIRLAFQEEYTFTPVYFIMAKDSRNLADSNWTDILTNAAGDTVQIKPTSYLLADFSTTKRNGLYGLNVWEWEETEWVHPPNPFPYHISGYGFLRLTKRTFSEMVEKFNSHFVEKEEED
ncbi:hypothetical protein [Phaeocystidibacter marisrubri]|uniref:Uncharacterized protein n=1 Tax=Phaeocystidibacter marisrubri TaxID=1577780 RepID=A0A6L3ZEQ1_9FLAO|nr:hypothetical protein [Phaeocystidibacter marisrubri]KAB2815862.1 hypothetical protein F8C82_09190 [Phaeocystidibacter marisrubri]GGH66109.1 hypothetical protein GCM10011318_03730 [Phaeocystidibacter marisrubri]